jgi:hypothetical protein
MRRRYLGRGSAALAALALTGTVLAAAPAAASDDTNEHCAAGFHAAVVEDNEAFNARDAARYEAILNPRMIFWQDGVTTYGRDAIMATARQSFALPGWTWTYQIESETVHGCQSGIAVATSVVAFPDQGIERHFAFTMYLVREHGKWTVAADNVHRVS